MEFTNNQSMQILNKEVNPLELINSITNSGLQENPFYIFDVNDLVEKYKIWNLLMPRVTPHYAVKCNNHPVVLRVLATLGTGFDCASKSEISQVLALGVHPNRIIYAHTTKPPGHIRHASAKNVDLLTFDNELELYKIKKLHPNAKAVIRIRYDDTEAICNLGLKFGCDAKREAPSLLKTAQSLGVEVVGVSFHVGSGCKAYSTFHGAIEAARDVFDVAADLNFNFNLLDIGGGYPGNSKEEIYKYSKIINLALEKFFPDESVRVISEPGTYFVDSAFTLAVNVHSARTVLDQDDLTTKHMYYLNDGAFGSFNDVISYNIIRSPILVKEYPDSDLHPSILWGPTCDSVDKLNDNIMLPKLELGDWLAFSNMGAYTIVICTNFNSFEHPDVYCFVNFENWLLLQKNSESFTESVGFKGDELILDVKLNNNEMLYDVLDTRLKEKALAVC